MMLTKKLVAGLVLFPLVVGIISPAFAEGKSETGESNVNETQALMNAKISIGDAIKTAEAEGKGKAVDSGLNDENGEISYQVEVVAADGKRTDVFVDLQTGKVLKMAAADAAEEGGDNEASEGSGGEQNEAN
jgi:Peptidase propeptide and YPEB domain